MQKRNSFLGFTLVELIVVITIIAILGTIGFVSLQGFSVSARESARVSDINTIARALEYYKVEEGAYPAPSNNIEITYSGSLAWRQGTYGEDTRVITGRISEVPVDPLTKSEYAYSITNTRQEYELGAISESPFSYNKSINKSLIPANLANANNRFFSNIKGNYNQQIVTVKQADRLFILGVPTIITTEINSVTVEEIIANQSFAIRNSANLPASYADNLGEGETHTGAISFTPGSISLTAPVIYEGTTQDLSDDSNKQQFGEDLRNYYVNSDIANQNAYQQLVNTPVGEELSYINTLIQADTGGIPGDQIEIFNIPPTISGYDLSNFITEWNIPSNNYSFDFPISGTEFFFNTPVGPYDFTLDWGDGSTSEITSFDDPDLNHIYVDGGMYEITASGTMSSFSNSIEDDDYPGPIATSPLLIRVISLGDMGWTYLGGAFGANENLISIDHGGDTSGVSSTEYMFYHTPLLESVALFDTSNVVDMRAMFSDKYWGNTSLTTIPLFDTSNVVDMSGMFEEATGLTSIPLLNTSKVVGMRNMFDGATSLTTVPLLDTSSVENMSSMFTLATSLTTVPLLDTSSVENMGSMFAGATSLTTIPLFDTSNVVSMHNMFGGATSLTTIPLLDIDNVRIAASMFSGATSLNVDLSSWDLNLSPSCGNFSDNTPSWVLPKPNFLNCIP